MNSHIKEIHKLLSQGAKVSTDTRQIENGCIFFALKGDKFDANDFAKQALEKGAIKAVIDKKLPEDHPGLLLVDDSLKTLQDLAVYHRNQFNIPVLGITGSNGKTTTKELINAVLSKKYNTLCTRGNLNNHIGVPLTLLNLNPSHELAIIEMGANHVGEIGFLSSLASPTYGLITNIGKAHIEGFGSFENIIKGKTELYEYIRNNGGSIFLNEDNEILSSKASGLTTHSYGKGSAPAVKGRIISSSPFLQIEFRTNELPQPIKVNSQLLGGYNFENIMSAVSAGLHFGVSPEMIREALENYAPANSRSQLKESGRNTLFLDSYNANPTSMRAAIENFSNLETKQPKGLILGDMLELGDTTHHEHEEIIKLTKAYPYSFVILVGEFFTKTCPDLPAYISFGDSAAAAAFIKNKNISDHTILMKGSRGIKLEIVEEFI
jgi:UDP-N-acetylmuramoyl-tripeptide--D-alanyl-D-alanine ligase